MVTGCLSKQLGSNCDKVPIMSLGPRMGQHTSFSFFFDPIPGSQEEEKTRNSFSYLHEKAHKRLVGRPKLFKEIIK